MAEKGADGPKVSSSGHRFGFKAAADAGVPFGWASGQPSPEQKERQQAARRVDAELERVLKKYPALRGHQQDEYGRFISSQEVLRSKAFQADLERAEGNALATERRRAALEREMARSQYGS